MKLLTIDRSKWLCGHELNRSKGKDSMLLNSAGEMCCLGFLGKQCGLTTEQLEEKFTPDGTIIELWPEGVLHDHKDSQWTAVAVRVNDSKSLSDTDREFILLDHFKAIGYAIEYTGSYQDKMYNGKPII